MQGIIEAASIMWASADQLDMAVCAAAARDLGDVFARLPSAQPQGLVLEERHLDDLIGGLDYLLRTFRDEIEARSLFVMSGRNVALFDQAEPLFGAAVDDAFPSSSFDISEAGKCLACGRWTAAVTHLMRALEAPLAVLAERVGVPGGVNWNKQLNEIESRLRLVSKSKDGPDEEQWAAEAASHFRAIKNGWRNRAMHGQETYDEERATQIYEAVRALLRHLANRLAE
ncbi:MAG: hypothetical protein ACJ8ER_15755 [Allosphingosinicella sp.]